MRVITLDDIERVLCSDVVGTTPRAICSHNIIIVDFFSLAFIYFFTIKNIWAKTSIVQILCTAIDRPSCSYK